MQLNTAIAWGGHAELFDFNAHTQRITADPDAALVPPTSTTENALGEMSR